MLEPLIVILRLDIPCGSPSMMDFGIQSSVNNMSTILSNGLSLIVHFRHINNGDINFSTDGLFCGAAVFDGFGYSNIISEFSLVTSLSATLTSFCVLKIHCVMIIKANQQTL
jgi:hypothetical protein